MTEILLIPGLWNSGPEHWQSYWEGARSDCRRVEQSDWQTPRRADWVEALDRAIGAAAGDVVLAAHSLGCATVAHWAATAGVGTREKVRGALLVAPSDVEAPNYPTGTVGFRPMPLEPLSFATIVMASQDDIWVSAARAEAFARAWGSRFVDVGNRGHINSDSKLGAWPEGQALLASLGA
ncbi:MAG TPA: alpha/beta hydrolase [Gemmatimonadaceae bacterium]|nr:alpha/beta hydrolase [Gemmatimonadaceae bacterium]